MHNFNKKTVYSQAALLITLLMMCNTVIASDCSEWENLDNTQKSIAKWLYKRGESHNLQYTLPSIVWTESTLGKYRLNIKSGDLGLAQINYKTANTSLGVTNYFKQAELHQRLIYDDELNITIAISVLEHFKSVHNGDWKKMIMSYNIGNNKSDKYIQRGLDYYKKATYYLNILRNCSNIT